MSYNNFKNHRIPMCAEFIGHIGDVDPVTYGGGIIYRHEQGHIVIQYTHGMESALTDCKYTSPRLEVYSVHFDADENILDTYDWANWDAIRSNWPDNWDSLEEMLASGDLWDKASVIHMLAEYHGWHKLDSYHDKYTEIELRSRWYGEIPDEEDAEREAHRKTAGEYMSGCRSLEIFHEYGDIPNLTHFLRELDEIREWDWIKNDTHGPEIRERLNSLREWATRESEI